MRPLFALVLFALAGCGGSKPDATGRVPTTGTATYRSRPAAGAVLLFHTGHAADAAPARARVNPDGTFAVHAPDGAPGVAAGTYRVTVEWRDGSGENGEDGKSRVAEKYLSAAKTPLRAEVRPGPGGACALPAFDLTK
jgi:hypothetical protein